MKNSESFFITTPIYYVNDRPHVGHAYTTIAADVLARYYRKTGRKVFFLTGTDEHGAKIAQAAAGAGKEPQAFADEHAANFKKIWQKLGIDYSAFIRTTDPKHTKRVQEFVRRLQDKGYLKKKTYEGDYCVGCEKYLTSDEIVDGKCYLHKTKPVRQKEENWFFLLSRLANPLLDAIRSGKFDVQPAARRNEAVGKIEQGLEDVSISRAGVKWGIPFPGDESQTIYVWVDALLNYYTATHIFGDLDAWEKKPADLHLMAKDILWFHAIIWPAMLLALDLPLPKTVFAHGFFTVAGEKMSKTLGNVLDPVKLADKFGADAVRYALLREFPFGEDGDISEDKIAARYKEDLADGLGNLLQRVLVLIDKSQVKIQRGTADNRNLTLPKMIEELKFDLVLTQIWESIRRGNEVIAKEKPWDLAKNNPDKCRRVLQNVYNSLVAIAAQIEPFMPDTAAKMQDQLKTLKPAPLFPRVE